ncbi:MAG TPA: LLM class flavin-dependent oxidoreductase [Candidatus Angelobacter sp.]|nr:LLM class flavin-dependent oxidoreductase [Candidatus Angelobacter sp.]
MSTLGLTIMGTCPTFQYGIPAAEYLERVRVAAVRAEKNGWTAMLIYSDHRQLDPWLVANLMLSGTTTISPLVAVQPLYMHPFSVAKMVSSMSMIYGRPVHLNFISGGFPRDLETFCDACSHDERYARMVEYGSIIRTLLTQKSPCSFRGKYYGVEGLQLRFGPMLPQHCAPIFTTSGSSPAGLAAARKLRARAIQYLRPAHEYCGIQLSPDLEYGARLGIVTRDSSDKAWDDARKRFPENPAGVEVRQYSISISDSVWVKELGKEVHVPEGHPYWLGPYRNNQAACPFLVGAKEVVALELADYIELGHRTFLIENTESDEDAEQIGNAFKLAEEIVLSRRVGARTVRSVSAQILN